MSSPAERHIAGAPPSRGRHRFGHAILTLLGLPPLLALGLCIDEAIREKDEPAALRPRAQAQGHRAADQLPPRHDVDLSRYQNNYQLYDTGQSTGHRIVLLDHNTPPRPEWVRVNSKGDAFTNSGPVLLSSGRFDTPIICEEHSTNETDIVHSLTKVSVSSVDALPASHGAIRSGGPADLFSTEYVGLLLNWLVIGFLNGGTSAIVAPVFTNYFHVDDFTADAIDVLLNFAWYFKFIFSFISDSCPIHGQRRKPYIYIGWISFTLFMVVMIIIPTVGPFTDAQVKADPDLATKGQRYVFPLMIASFSHLMATVACEGIMVELAQREGEFARGQTQCIVVMFRFVGEFLGSLVLTLGANDAEYGGDFNVALPLQAIFGVFGFVASLGLAFTKYFLVDESLSMSAQPVKMQLRRVWGIAQQRHTMKLMIFGFVCKVATTYNVLEAKKVYSVWLRAKEFDTNMSSTVQTVGSVLSTFLVYKLWLNTNWRALLLASLAIGVVIALPVEFVTYYNVIRDLSFYLTKDQLVNMCDIVIWLIRQLVIIEVSEPGYEATTYGMITTVYNLANPLVMFVRKALPSLGLENLSQKEFATDTSDVRLHMTVEQVVKIAVRVILILAVTPLLPRQKRDVDGYRTIGAKSPTTPIVLIAVFTVIFIASISPTSSLSSRPRRAARSQAAPDVNNQRPLSSSTSRRPCQCY